MTDEQKPLTDQDLDEIKRRADAATPGPWGAAARPQCDGDMVHTEEECICAGPLRVYDDEAAVMADAAFIAAAREDVPRLLAEVRRCRGGWRVANEQVEKLGRASDVWIESALREHLPTADNPFERSDLVAILRKHRDGKA